MGDKQAAVWVEAGGTTVGQPTLGQTVEKPHSAAKFNHCMPNIYLFSEAHGEHAQMYLAVTGGWRPNLGERLSTPKAGSWTLWRDCSALMTHTMGQGRAEVVWHSQQDTTK